MKPIFTVGLPKSDNHKKDTQDLLNFVDFAEKKMKDYHVICYPSLDREPRFALFSAKDITEKEIADIQADIYDYIGLKMNLK